MSHLNSAIDRLSPERRALLARHLRTSRQPVGGEQLIPPRQESGPSPLSFAQQGLWVLDQLDPGNSAYNLYRDARIKGPLDVRALQQSLNEIVRRHEVLRTTYYQTATGEPRQRIAPEASITLSVADLSGVVQAEREAELQRLLAAARRPFDLAHDLMLRAELVRLGAQEHVLALTFHHIAVDQWSMGVFSRELAALYRAFAAGQSSPLPELPLQYADYAVWERNSLQGEWLQAELAHWKQELDGAPPVLELPTDKPRPSVQTFRGGHALAEIPAPLVASLSAVGRRQGATLFMTLLAAFQALLARLAGQAEVVVGVAVAGRSKLETEGLIGLFVNLLPLRTDLSDGPPFAELLRRVRAKALSAYAHQHLPFEQMVGALRLPRDPSRNPLVQVVFNMFNLPAETTSWSSGLTVSSLPVPDQQAKFDLTLDAQETAGGLTLTASFNADLFTQARIVESLEQYRRLLEQVTGNPDEPVGRSSLVTPAAGVKPPSPLAPLPAGWGGSVRERFADHACRESSRPALTGMVTDPQQRLPGLALLTEAERRQLLVEWNATGVAYPSDKCLHQLFEEQVRRTPEAVAVVFEDRMWTYRELDARANRLAWRLQRLGVAPDVLVGVCLERSLELVVGLLGVLKAGGAYVPLDPDYPKDRLAFMLEDSRVPVLLTQERLRRDLPCYGGQVLCLDGGAETAAEGRAYHPEGGPGPEHLAYVIYTSGSTGKPKGAMNTQRGISNRLLWMQETYRLTAEDRVLQKTPFSFDVSVWEFFWPLLAGARLVVARPGGHRDSAYLVRLMAEQRVTVLHFVPSMLQVFLEEEGLEHLTSLREVICSGEALPWELQERFFARLPARLHNLYGPTEAAVDVTFWACERGDGRRLVPIGRPIANTQMYVLDGCDQAVPVGVAGELYIGGVALARGYLNRPDLTAERFVAHPFAGPGGRLYKTGDRARWLPDGTLEYLGRLDHQVKIRGFRIELGEVEAALGQHPAVREAVVVAREDRPGDKRLVAYLVAKGGTAPSGSDLRDLLKRTLPEYMVPSAFVALDRLPTTPNGKVDRKALPAPEGDRPDLGRTYVAPRTPLEERLAGIWREAQGLEQVGIRDNFFELGGNSLLAVQVIARIRDAFHVDLPVRLLFEIPTLGDMARVIEQALLRDAEPDEMTSLLAELDRMPEG